MKAKVDARDGRQRPKTANHHLPHVEARDVFYNHPARLNDASLESCELHADHQVSRSAVPAAQRSAGVRSNNAANGRLFCKWRIECDHLAILREQRLKLSEA